MPGNVPNISGDNFNALRNYMKVSLQQGVPILDSDWNELQDIIRMALIKQNIATLGNCRLAPGSSGNSPGFVLSADGSDNNFQISAGLACVEGVIVPSKHDEVEPTSDIWYDSEDNYLMDGTVTAIGSGTITDENTVYELFMDLVGCRLYMTSGVESGNSFPITSRDDATTLGFSGGIGSIASGDTYKILPPVLTTPSASRTDVVYIQAWFDDINAEEDTDLLNAALGLEPSHRSKIRSVVRVAEGGSTPTTPSPYSFGVRYMEIGTIERVASAAIQSYYMETGNNSAYKAGLSGDDTSSDYPQLLWRNLGWKEDSEVIDATISLYQFSGKLFLVIGGYMKSDFHIWTGGASTRVKMYSTDGNIRISAYTTFNTDLGDYSTDSNWAVISKFNQNGATFYQGGQVQVDTELLMNEGAKIKLDDNAHLEGDNLAVTPSGAMKLFRMDVGLHLQMLYTDREMWWLINTTYDTSAKTFVSISGLADSYILRLSSGVLRIGHHSYSGASWDIDEWTALNSLGTTRVGAQDLALTREKVEYIDEHEQVIPRYPGFLLVTVEFATLGEYVAMYRVDTDVSLLTLVSGDATYFTNTYDNAYTVNVSVASASNLNIQNKTSQTVDIRYGYVRLDDTQAG